MTRSESATRSWHKRSVATARRARHHVMVHGVEYRSVRDAFVDLDLPLAKHVTFRMKLKASKSGRAAFEGHMFKLIDPHAKTK